MNKTKKLICLAVLTVLMLLSVIALVACSGNAKEALESYMPSFAGKSVKDDFELPRTIGDNVKVSWKSSNSDAIEVVTRGKNETYLAKVKLGDTVQAVTLTVSAGGASKDFTVNVQALNATLIASEYEFKYNRAEVSEDFDLPATAEIRGVTAQITWSVDEKYSEYIEVKDGRCVVNLPSETTRVEINATFSYKSTTATMPYTFYVAQPKSHRESVNAWYQSANVTLGEVKGYVVGIATAYSDSYKNVSMYVVDEDMCSGYYLFRCKGSIEDGAKLKVGVHVTITSLTSSDYNGLMESTSDCSFVVDDDLASKDVKDLVYALDNDATSGSPALKWHTGSLASLTNWTVKSIESNFSSKAGTMMTITKDDAEIAVAYNNYMEGFYTSTDNNPAATQFNLSRFNVGDTISVTGIVSYHSGFQVMPRNADDIVKAGTADTNPTDGSKVKAAIAEVEGKFSGIDGLITTTRTFNLPTTSNGVNITYTKTYNGSSVAIEGGKITVTPQDKLQVITVEAEYKIGNYTTWTYFTLRSQNLDDQGKVDYVKGLIEETVLEEVTKTGDVTLPSNSEFDGLTIVWSVKNGKPDWLEISGDKLTINQLPTEETVLTLVANISLNGKTAQAELTLTVAKQSVVSFKAIDAPVEGTELLFAMYPSDLNRWYYATGVNSGNYLGTTTDPEQAGKFVITKQGDDTYIIKTGEKFLEVVKNDTYYNAQVVDKQTEGQVWKWDADNKIFYMEHGTEKYYMGTYAKSGQSSFETISASKWSYLATATGKAQFGTLTTDVGGGEDPTPTPETKYGIKVATELQASTDYYLGLYNTTKSAWYFFTGVMGGYNDYYFATSDNKDDAAIVVLEAHDGGYYIKVKSSNKYLTLGPRSSTQYSSSSLSITDTATTVWKYDEATKCFTTELVDGEQKTYKFYLGNYGNNTDFAGLSKFDDSSYAGVFGDIVPTTELGGGGDVDPTPTPDPEPEVNHGTEEAPLTVAEFLALTDLPTGSSNSDFDVWVKGYVVKSVQGPSKGEYNLYITDQKGNAGTTVQIYWAACDQQPFIGDFIVVNGYVKKYNDSYELTKNNNASNTNVITIKERSSDAVSVEIVENENATLSADKQSGTNGQQIVITAKPNQGYDFVKLTVEGVEITATNADGNYIAYIGDYDGDSKTTIELTVKLHVEKTYTLVESTDVLVEGAVVVFAYKYTSGDTTSIWMAGEMSGSILSVIKDAATLSADGKSLSQVNLLVQEFTIGKTDGHYTFAIDGNLLGITSTGNGKLSTSDSNRTSTWDITIADGVATILSTVIDDGKDAPTCKLQCNTNSNQERFANYKTGSQKDFQLFLVEEAE